MRGINNVRSSGAKSAGLLLTAETLPLLSAHPELQRCNLLLTFFVNMLVVLIFVPFCSSSGDFLVLELAETFVFVLTFSFFPPAAEP